MKLLKGVKKEPAKAKMKEKKKARCTKVPRTMVETANGKMIGEVFGTQMHQQQQLTGICSGFQ